MATILTTTSRQPSRITVSLDAVPSTNPTNYTISRPDFGPTVIRVTVAWLIGPTTVELALSEPMVDGVIYVVAVAGSGSAQVAYRQPAAPGAVQMPGEPDPEAEAFGVDIAWITSPALTSAGDVPQRRGAECLRSDLAAIAVTDRGELFHRPDDGAGLNSKTNGPGNASGVGAVGATVKRQWLSDDRVRRVDLSATANALGQVTVNASVTPIVTTEQLQIRAGG